MPDLSRDFVQRLFLQYYTECFDQVGVVQDFARREFAGLLMQEKMMVRHKSFRDRSELQSFLCSLVPSDVYYSAAHYEQPDASEMGAKGWVGADLIFDIDADHIPTTCDKIHDEWVCLNCGLKGKGELPQTCPICGGEKFVDNTWPCEKCLDSAKSETIRLIDFLLNDFGFCEKDVHVYFSGNRGYHVQVENDEIQPLETMARKDIVDYIGGLGFDVQLLGLSDENVKSLDLKSAGWRGHVARGIYNTVLNANIEDYQHVGLKKNAAEIMLKNRDAILKDMQESKPWACSKA